MADQQFSDETKQQMRDTVLRWIGEGDQPADVNSNGGEDNSQAREAEPAAIGKRKPDSKIVAKKNKPEGETASVDLPNSKIVVVPEEMPVIVEKIDDFSEAQNTARKSTVTDEKSKQPASKKSIWSNWLKPFKEARTDAIEDRGGWKYFLAASLSVLIIWVMAFVVIRQGYLNPPVRQFLAENIPVPYARLGSQFLWLPTWYDERAAIDHYYQQNPTTGMDIVQTRDIAGTAMVRRAMLEELASQYKLRVSESEINAEVARLQSNMGSSDSLNRLVQTIWGWSLADFRGKLIRPYLLKQKLIAKLKEDPVLGRDFGQGSDQQILDQYLDKLAKSQLSQWIDLDRLP